MSASSSSSSSAAASVWPAVLRLAAERFGLPPREVWRLSVREWRALIAPASPAGPPLTRAGLDALLLLHPDDPS